MFYYLKGTVAVMEANLAVIDCGGVGYACHTTAYTLSRLRLGQPAQLLTYCNIREDAFDIFGFDSKEEKKCFEQLIGVTGVGPKAALSILSATTPERFTMAILTGDEKALTVAQGVGKKLAQRILLELKDKIASEQTELDFSGGSSAQTPVHGNKAAEAAQALAVLGYTQADISLALKGVDAEKLTVEEIVRQALRAMVTK